MQSVFSNSGVVVLVALFIGSYVYLKDPTHAATIFHSALLKFDTNPPKTKRFSSESLIVQEVERIEWAPHLTFNKEMTSMREPTILTNTVVSQWPAIKKWPEPGYLSEKQSMQMLKDVQVGPHHTFGFIDNNTALAKTQHPGITLIPNYRMVNMSMHDFWQLSRDPKDQYYYWYGKVPQELKEDVSPNEGIWRTKIDQQEFGLFMWLTSRDVRPPIHYDMDHNFYVHVSGTKRFVLFPPWEWKNLHTFPRIHPKWHKAQSDFEFPDLEVTPRYSQAKAYEAVLNPGDILYIPPYWWHHVQSVTPCISMASWSQSGVYQEMKKLYARKIQFEKISDPEERKAGMRAYIEILVSRLYPKEEVKKFHQDLLTRFYPIRSLFTSLPSWTDPKFCNFQEIYPTSHFEDRFEEDVSYAVEKLNQCQGLDVDQNWEDVKAIRELELIDFIEIISSEILGAENVFAFFSKCFQV
eukprot:TRINITY_DN1103_c0_g2_i2.p1 TRINITY_DN1103_c0_g2~~TRINITY_DN1103_c0_g2_i2.p1  ORF type:complete len:466 (+),score=121.45 TRINITY_DN1103_c0_g2_i2:12-1409(+)